DDVITKRIPDVNYSDDLSLWLKLLDEDGLSKNASDLLDKESLSALENFSNNKRPGAAAVMEGDNFSPVSATSIRNGSVDYFDGINPLIKDLLEQIKKSGIQSNGHGKCAEVKVLSDVLNNHFKNKVPTLEEAIDYLRGTKSKAVSLKRSAKNAGSHGKFKCACVSCSPLMKRLKVIEVSY
ncbi:MAG: hypothetical protein MI784_15495, partial [Cytophagales bacterium]|nr:hypothetical protein [Cytophagales bacterium]